jgi:SET domain-containing protein 6
VIKPMIESRADLFPVPEGTSWEDNYGLGMYHRMGSLVLSRSFHVEASSSSEEDDPDEGHDVSMESAHSLAPGSVENGHSTHLIHGTLDQHSELGNEDEGEEEEEEREAVEDIAMVPLADLLNAKTGSENVGVDYQSFRLMYI